MPEGSVAALKALDAEIFRDDASVVLILMTVLELVLDSSNALGLLAGLGNGETLREFFTL